MKNIKNILLALAIVIFSYVSLILAFILDAVYQSVIRGIAEFFIPFTLDSKLYWFPVFMHLSFVLIIGIISWFIFKSKLKSIYKAIFMPVPMAVVYATIGMFFNRLPIVVYLLGALFGFSVLCYIYKKKQSWMYYFSLFYITLLMLLVVLLGIEI
jgi:hypothetical protein